MTLEWLRRKDPVLDRNLRQYLFTEGPITAVEEEAMVAAEATAAAGGEEEGGAPEAPPGDGSLGIGSLKWVVL
jgi:hypothetical protein